MLVSLTPTLIINTQAITSVEALSSAKNRERCKFKFTDATYEIVDFSIEDLDWLTGSVIPAPPGYRVIKAFEPDETGKPWIFDTYPVLAFRLTDSEPVPIIPYGKLGEHWALVWPDGRCDQQWNRIFETAEAFKASFEPNMERT